MKTYPYHTPNGIIELVEKREYDKLQAASVELTRWQALARQLAQALATCQGFIEDAHIIEAQWDWEPIKEAKTALSAYESANLEPVANPIDVAVKRMEAVPLIELSSAWDKPTLEESAPA